MRKSNGTLIEECSMRSSKTAGVTEVLLRAEFYQTQLSYLHTDRQTYRHDMSPNPSLDVEQRLPIRLHLGGFKRDLDSLWAAFMSTYNDR
jgi:hypothetical protein